MMMKEKGIEILFSYHRHDIAWIDLFTERLEPFREKNQFTIIYDEVTDSSKDPSANQKLISFDIIVYFVSRKFVLLNNFVEKEIPEMIPQFQERGIRIIPIHLEHCPWQSISWLHDYKLWPLPQLAFSDMSDNEKENYISRFIKDELKLGGAEENKSANVEEKDGKGQNVGEGGLGGKFKDKDGQGQNVGEGGIGGKFKDLGQLSEAFEKFLVEKKGYDKSFIHQKERDGGFDDRGIDKGTRKYLAIFDPEKNKLLTFVEFGLNKNNLIIQTARQYLDYLNRDITSADIEGYVVFPDEAKLGEEFSILRLDKSSRFGQGILFADFPTYEELRRKRETETEASVGEGSEFEKYSQSFMLYLSKNKGYRNNSMIGEGSWQESGVLLYDVTLSDPESGQMLAVIEVNQTNEGELYVRENSELTERARDLGVPLYVLGPDVLNSSDEYGIQLVTEKGDLEYIAIEDFPAYEEFPHKKLTWYDFKSKLDMVGKKIFDKVVAIAKSSNLKVYTNIPDESYVNLRLIRSKGKSDTNVVIQIHRYGEDKTRVALAVAGIKTGAIGLAEPKLNDYITNGVMSLLSGYQKGIPGEITWLNGNLPVKGTREKVSIYVIERDILVNIEAWNAIEELFEWAVKNFDKLPPEEPDRGGEISQRIPGVSNDNVVDDAGPLVDRLGIEGEVNALSAMIAAKGTEPPLSIGLFGDWGSGKSFFMGKMRQRITAIAEESEKCVRNNEGSYFCQNIVQIPFNAWHYMDANLWASLVTHIFDKLAEHLAGDEKQTVEEKKKELVKKVKSAQEMLESAKEKEEEANEALKSAKGELETSEGEVAERKKSVSQLTPRAMAVSVMKNEKIVARIDGAASMLGLKDMPKTIGELEKTINDCRQIGERAHRFWNSLGQSKKQIFAWAIALTVVPGFIIWKICSGMNGEFQRVGTIISVIGGFVVWIKPKLKAINEGFGELEAARDAAYAEMDKSYNKETEGLREEVVVAERVCDAAREKVERAEGRLSRAKKDREEIETGKRLHDYIMERSNDSKYKNKLGIVSMIREDFKGLSELVTESRKDDTPGELRKIERIVLYIDDLDRCPSDRVVEVLQAIHLILAFKLFIVVVGVDCRWILHALRKEYSAFGGGNGKFEGSGRKWLTTPHNYVEKIFQIPFALEQMEDDGYRELVAGLTDVKEQEQAEEERGEDMESPKIDEGKKSIEDLKESGADKDKKVKGDEVSSGGKDDKPDDDDKDKADQGEEETDKKRANEGIGEMNMTPDELLLEEWEIEFMKELGDFVSSPRATKRFVNIYKLICATLTDRERLAKFKGTKDDGGDYQAVQLMLGILTGFPNQACDVLKAIKDNAEEEKDIREFVKKLKTKKVRISVQAVYRNIAKSEISKRERVVWDRLHEMLEDKVTKLGINTSFKPFGDWAGLVGRFSFQYGRASELQAEEIEEEAGSAKQS